jgi:carbamoylphosphate synthase large subunit
MKILILGTSFAQIDLIKFCKEQNLNVYGCAYERNETALEYLDKFELLDIKDLDKILEFVEKEKIDLIHSIGAEHALPTIGYVSEKLGLPYFVGYRQALIFRDKYQIRSILDKNLSTKAYNIKSMRVDNLADIDNWDSFPAILKPIDGAGQRGVNLIETKEDFIKHYEHSMKFSISKNLIIEEFIEGPELSINIHMYEGEIVFFQITDRISFLEYPGGLIKSHKIPSRITNQDLDQKIFKMASSIINQLNIINGPVYIQLRLNNDTPKLIEITPRLDGCHLWRLIKYYNGIDILKLTINHLFENKIVLNKNYKEQTEKNLTLLFQYEKPNEKVTFNEDNLKDQLYKEWYYDEGDIVKSVNGFYEKIGYCIIPK